jgi:hypothetical protein
LRNGIYAGPLDLTLSYSVPIDKACKDNDFSSLLAYAIKLNETGNLPNACEVISYDNGHGLFQLTYSWPENWTDAYTNAAYAVTQFLRPAEDYWAGVRGEQGDDLIRCIAAEFNAGRTQACAGHDEGDVDKYTTNRYGARALSNYHSLLPKES